jgi:hypothetical protein
MTHLAILNITSWAGYDMSADVVIEPLQQKVEDQKDEQVTFPRLAKVAILTTNADAENEC